MQVQRMRVVRYRHVANCEIKFGDLSVFVGPNGVGKSTILRALEFGIAGPSSSDIKALNGNPSLLQQLTMFGFPEVEVELFLDLNERRLFQVAAKLPETQVVATGWTTLILKRQLHQYTPGHVQPQIQDKITLHGPSLETPVSVPVKNNIDRALNDWLSHYAPTIVLADRRLTGTVSHSENPERNGNRILTRLHQSATDRSNGKDPLFERVESVLSSVLSDFSSFRPVRRNSENDLEVDGYTSMWLGAGHKEIIAIVGEVLDSSSPLICVEEPERGVHPGLIPSLLEAIRKAAGTRQLVLTTHSPSIAASCPMSALWEVTKEAQVRRVDPNNMSALASSLGVTPGDVLDHDVLLFVEGPGDEGAWNNWLGQSGLRPWCAALSIGGYGNVGYYANAALVNLRVTKPIVCVLFDKDIRSRHEGTLAINEAEQFASAHGGLVFDLSREMLEDYLLDSKAIARIVGTKSEVVEDAIFKSRAERQNKGKPFSSKGVLQDTWYRLTGNRFRAVDDAVLIATSVHVGDLPDEMKKVLCSVRELLVKQRGAMPVA